jgi:magnesium transporter
MELRISEEQISRALEERNYGDLRNVFAEMEPADVAEIIEGLAPDDRAVVFRLLKREQAADTFEQLEMAAQETLIKALGQTRVSRVLNDMSPDDRTRLLEEMPAAVTQQLLSLLSPEERVVARQLLGYPEDSIGRLMTPDFIMIRENWTVQQALDHIRHRGQDSETLNVIYVVDQSGALVDDLRVRQLLLAELEVLISEITDGHYIALKAIDDQETAVTIFKEYDRAALPVVDSRGALLGIVTWDDVMDVAEEEATEDIQKLGGSEALEQPYLQVGYFDMLRKRAGWLIVLFLGQLLTLNAMGFFAAKIEEALVLVFFVPLIISTGGNSGSQAATLVIRAMALEEVSQLDWWTVMRRELGFGLTVGAILSLLGYLRIVLGEVIGSPYGTELLGLDLAVGLTLICVVLWGVLLGSMLPFAMRALGVDPATSSTPFVATLADITGLIIYLSIASLVL